MFYVNWNIDEDKIQLEELYTDYLQVISTLQVANLQIRST